MNNDELIYMQLLENLKLLDNSVSILEKSYAKCIGIKINEELSFEQLESLEALTARFARTSDILTQKVCKSLFILLQEDIKTFLDGANLLAKIEIIDEAKDIINIRQLRNIISHEYKEEDIKEIFKKVLTLVPIQFGIIQKVKEYIKNKI